MGIFFSCHSTSVAKSMLIFPDGSLQEFSHAVKVSEVLRKNPDTFICNSDDMEFDNIVSAIKDDDELQPAGELYFALPLKRLKYPLQPEEMAALAVKAAAALAKCGCSRLRRKNICFTFSGEKRGARSSSKVMDAGTIGLSRGSWGSGAGKKQNFKAMLSAIPE